MVAWLNHRCLQMFLHVCLLNSHCKISPFIFYSLSKGHQCLWQCHRNQSCPLLGTYQNIWAFEPSVVKLAPASISVKIFRRYWRFLKCIHALENRLLTKKEHSRHAGADACVYHLIMSFKSVSRTRDESNSGFPARPAASLKAKEEMLSALTHVICDH